MNRFARSILAVFVLLAVGGSVIAAAQDMSNPPFRASHVRSFSLDTTRLMRGRRM